MMATVKPKVVKVPRACDRCKRQKLKCDVERPCLLCTRSGVACTSTSNAFQTISSTSASKARNKRKRDESHPTEAHRPRPEPSSGIPSSGDSSDAEAPPSLRFLRQETVTTTEFISSSPRPGSSHEAKPAAFAGDSSAMGLTKQVFSFNDSQHRSTTSALPGGSNQRSLTSPDLPFFNPYLPPAEIVEALIDSYFDTVHWSMFLLHQPSFRRQAKQLVALGSRIRSSSDADFAALLMMVIALGAQYGASDPNWKHRHLLSQHSIDLQPLVRTLTRQVRTHLLDLLERGQLEAVQVCVLLGTYYIYHGNPNLSWSILGLAVKAAYAIGMHREMDWKGEYTVLQGRKRAWGHTFIADTFSAVVYGRPATVDRAFCDISYPDECEDTEIPMPLRQYLRSVNGGKDISQLSYHTHKYRLYEIKAQIVSKIYTLRARASFQASGAGVPKLVKMVQSFDSKLKAWKNNLSPYFKESSWTSGNGNPGDVFRDLHHHLSETEEQIKRHLVLQKVLLQVLYDYILILLHRPLLEYRMCSGRPGQTPESSVRNPFPNSFNTCMEAAMRISYTPAGLFEYNCAMSLLTMHLLPAGVILCIPATMDPFSTLAHKAKGAVVRMIRMFKRLAAQSPVVAQSCTILEELMKVVLKRELELVLNPEEQKGDAVKTETRENGLRDIIREDFTKPEYSELRSTLHPPAPQIKSPPSLRRSESLSSYVSGSPNLHVPPPNGHRGHHQQTMLSPDFLPQQPQGHNHSPGLHAGYKDTSISPETYGSASNQTYDFLDAEPDQGFNIAFGALERVIYDVAPSEWTNPAWMRSYEDVEPYATPSNNFGEGLMGLAPELGAQHQFQGSE